MKLFHTPSSPFVRKVLVLAHEVGLRSAIELVTVKLSPIASSAEVNAENPLGKIPTLILDDGTTLFDSRVICEYLDSIHDGPRFLPPSGVERWRVLRTQALADGVLDAAILCRYEVALRPAEQRSSAWLEGQWGKVERGLAELERCASVPPYPRDLGHIAAACALSYLDFRFPERDWRAGCPALAAFYAEVAQRPSLLGTALADPG